MLASEIKLNPDIFFSNDLEIYCNELGKFWQLHSDAIQIILINIAATVCEQSYVLRANEFKKPLNLYNCLVAKIGTCFWLYFNIRFIRYISVNVFLQNNRKNFNLFSFVSIEFNQVFSIFNSV
jgi:hypothetical protein